MDAIKTASERAIQTTTEATGDLIGNKIADKIKSVSKNPSNKLHLKNCHEMKLIMKCKKIYIHIHKKDNKLLMN